MDISKEYIDMCRWAKEIQERHIPENGDYELRFSRNLGQVEVFHNREMTAYYKPSDHVWLPRQDQLQAMVLLPSEFHRVCDKLYAFTEWVKTNATYETSSCTLEQLWLAFVMYRKGKVWDGKDWVKK